MKSTAEIIQFPNTELYYRRQQLRKERQAIDKALEPVLELNLKELRIWLAVNGKDCHKMDIIDCRTVARAMITAQVLKQSIQTIKDN